MLGWATLLCLSSCWGSRHTRGAQPASAAATVLKVGRSPMSGPSPSRTISPRSASYFLAVQGITLTWQAGRPGEGCKPRWVFLPFLRGGAPSGQATSC